MINFFVDTNVLVYAACKKSKFYRLSQDFLTNNRCFISDQIYLEFINVCLRNKLYQCHQALELLDNIVSQDNVSLIHPTGHTFEIWRLLQDGYQLSKRHLFDSYITATMLANGLEHLATFNTKDFAMFKEIKLHSWSDRFKVAV